MIKTCKKLVDQLVFTRIFACYIFLQRICFKKENAGSQSSVPESFYTRALVCLLTVLLLSNAFSFSIVFFSLVYHLLELLRFYFLAVVLILQHY